MAVREERYSDLIGVVKVRHMTPNIYVPRALSKFTPIHIHSQLSCFTYCTKLTHQSAQLLLSATSSLSAAHNSWFVANLPPIARSIYSPFPSSLAFTYRTKPSICTLNNHHTTLSQSNINRKPLAYIYAYQDTRLTIYIKTLHSFEQFSPIAKQY